MPDVMNARSHFIVCKDILFLTFRRQWTIDLHHLCIHLSRLKHFRRIESTSRIEHSTDILHLHICDILWLQIAPILLVKPAARCILPPPPYKLSHTSFVDTPFLTATFSTYGVYLADSTFDIHLDLHICDILSQEIAPILLVAAWCPYDK